MSVALGDELESEAEPSVEVLEEEASEEAPAVEADEVAEAEEDAAEDDGGEEDAVEVAEDEEAGEAQEEAVVFEEIAEDETDADGEDAGEAEEEGVLEEVEMSMAEALGVPEVVRDEAGTYYDEEYFGPYAWNSLQDFDTDGDNMLSQEELDKVGSLDLYGSTHWDDDINEEVIDAYLPEGFFDLFKNVYSIYVDDFAISGDVDLGGKNRLNSVTFWNCRMGSLNLGSLPGLDGIRCYNVELDQKSLDLSQCPNLTRLECNSCRLGTLTFGNNKELFYVDVQENLLTGLNLGKCPNLSELYCSGNSLESLDVSGCPELITLNCGGNKLKSLDVSGCPRLQTLVCAGNSLTGMNLENCPMLSKLDCRGNQLEALDLAKHPHLYYLRCEGNRYKKNSDEENSDEENSYEENQPTLTELDITPCGALVMVYNKKHEAGWGDFEDDYYFEDDEEESDDGEEYTGDEEPEDTVQYYRFTTQVGDEDYVTLALTFDSKTTQVITKAAGDIAKVALNSTNFPDSRFLKAVKYFDFDTDKKLSEGEIQLIASLEIYDERITSLKGIEYLTALRYLSVFSKVKSVNLSKNTELVSLSIEADLTKINLSHNAKLENLSLYNNALKALNVSVCPKLKDLYCFEKGITSLDLSQNLELERLTIISAPLTSLDLTHNSKLDHLEVKGTKQLKGLDLSGNPKLHHLTASIAKLTSLDLSHNPELDYLYVGGATKLTRLDLSCLTELTGLDIVNCGLTALDISHNPDLENAWLYGNKIKKLDVSQTPYLRQIVEGGKVKANKKGLYLWCNNEDDMEMSLLLDPTVEIVGASAPTKSVLVKKATGTKKTVFIGDRLIPALYGAKVKSVKSSKADVASAVKRSHGVVITAQKAGTATVTITLTNKTTRKLTVTVLDPNAPKSVSLAKAACFVPMGDTLALEATMKANRAGDEPISGLTWTSSSTKIATVDENGVVTPVKKGTATITVTTVVGKKTASCKVTVEDPNLPKGVALDKTAVSCFAGQYETIELQPTVEWWDLATEEAKAAGTTFSWSTSNKAIATVKKTADGALVTPVSYGKVTITVKTANGKTAKCVVNIARNKLDKLHAKPTAKQIAQLAKYEPVGFLKSIEIVNRNKIVTEWYLMNGKNKELKKTPTMVMRVYFHPAEGEDWTEIPPATEGGDYDYIDNRTFLLMRDYDKKMVNVPAKGYKLIKATTTQKSAIEFFAAINLKEQDISLLDWDFEWVGE